MGFARFPWILRLILSASLITASLAPQAFKALIINCIAIISDQTFLKTDRQKYFYIDSLLTSNLAYEVFINADSSVYFKTKDYINSCYGRKSYSHFVCFDIHNKTSSLKFLKGNDIASQKEIKPNWTYVVVRIY